MCTVANVRFESVEDGEISFHEVDLDGLPTFRLASFTREQAERAGMAYLKPMTWTGWSGARTTGMAPFTCDCSYAAHWWPDMQQHLQATCPHDAAEDMPMDGSGYCNDCGKTWPLAPPEDGEG